MGQVQGVADYTAVILLKISPKLGAFSIWFRLLDLFEYPENNFCWFPLNNWGDVQPKKLAGNPMYLCVCSKNPIMVFRDSYKLDMIHTWKQTCRICHD